MTPNALTWRILARRFGLLFLCLCITACTAQYLRWQPQTYQVQKGDTLYSIAWRYQLDYRTLAAWNDIGSNYLIYPGQRLHLTPSTTAKSRNAQTDGTTLSATALSPAVAADSAAIPSASEPDTVRLSALDGIAWRWPTNGPIIADYNASNVTGKGIDIGGQMGVDINAAAAGRVVYSGSGLVGYGKLIIIKHTDQYLSAYGHNSELYVHEGDEVRAGVRIAAMGNGPNRTPMLHFEIRRNGESVNPMNYLPAR